MGFPGFYDRNMNAWIDCMSYIDELGAGMNSYDKGAPTIE